jgi:hypothetical protein
MGDFQGHPFRGNQWTDGVGSSPRMDAPSRWSNPEQVRETIASAASATKQRIASGEFPLIKLGDPNKVGGMVLAQYQADGTVHVFPGFFEESATSRVGLLSHEFGHEVAMRAFSGGTASERTSEVLKPFRLRPNDAFSYDNFAGLSQRGEEMVADVYADLMTSRKQPWEDEAGKYAPVYKHVLAIAEKAGLPMPAWFVKPTDKTGWTPARKVD